MDNTKTNAVEATAKITYQFTAVPTNLIYLLDSDCFKLLTLLIQEHSYWNSKNRLEDGYFFKSIEEIQNTLFMKNDQDARLTIESLYINGFIDVIMLGKKHQSNKFKINWNRIEEYDNISITDIIKFYKPITKMKRGTKCTYIANGTSEENNINNSTTNCPTDWTTNCSPNCSPNCTPTLDNIDKLNNLENSNKLENKEKLNLLYNIYNSKSNLLEKIEYLESIDEGELFPFIKHLLKHKLINRDFYYKIVNKEGIAKNLKSFQVLELNANANYL